ncbi:MAG: taurine dioxygenase [Betaproteobacteria bacterium HGW-Betaproteobacteria-10]|nr:MAG: taurine dioxygenase [Betaproteobacteria bacterium HGW-Betaproteobacteria-10]
MSFYQDYNDKLAIEQWNTRQRPSYQHIKVTPISPALGAEVEGLDLRQDISTEQLAELKTAIADNLVLVFRDQAISAEEHKRFARHFGTLHQHLLAGNIKLTARSKDPEILGWKTSRESRYTAGDAWHNDVSCDAEPIWASFLRLTRLPESGGGNTAFANLYLAYESLSDPFKQLLDSLTAVHDGSQAWNKGYGAEPEPGQTFPASEHPVVARHPLTGRKFLFVNEAFTSHIVQLTRAESDAVLKLLYRHIQKHLSFQTHIRWTPNTLVFWDNWATQHHAIWDYYPFERWGERVSAFIGHGPQKA